MSFRYAVSVKHFSVRYSSTSEKKNPFFLQGSQVSPICLSGKGNVQKKGVRNNGAIMLTGINQSTRRKTSLSAIVYTTDFKWTVLSSNPGLRVEGPETNLSHNTVDKAWNLSTQYLKIQFLPHTRCTFPLKGLTGSDFLKFITHSRTDLHSGQIQRF